MSTCRERNSYLISSKGGNMSRLSRVTEEKLARVDPIFPPSPPPLPLQPAIAVAPPSRHFFALPALLEVLWFIFLPSTRGAPFCFCLPNPAVFLKKRCNTYQCISLNLHGINASKKTSNDIFCTRPPLFLIFIGLVSKTKESLI